MSGAGDIGHLIKVDDSGVYREVSMYSKPRLIRDMTTGLFQSHHSKMPMQRLQCVVTVQLHV